MRRLERSMLLDKTRAGDHRYSIILARLERSMLLDKTRAGDHRYSIILATFQSEHMMNTCCEAFST